MVVNGRNLNGWTHHAPDFANSTTRCPGCAPRTRPAIGAIRSGPPGAASGTSVNSTAYTGAAGLRAQSVTARQTMTAAHNRTVSAMSASLVEEDLRRAPTGLAAVYRLRGIDAS